MTIPYNPYPEDKDWEDEQREMRGMSRGDYLWERGKRIRKKIYWCVECQADNRYCKHSKQQEE